MFFPTKQYLPEIISGISQFSLILTSTVNSCMKSFPSAGPRGGDFCITLGFLGFRSTKGKTCLHSGPVSVPSGVVGQEKQKCS